jgi:hypothetical protein
MLSRISILTDAMDKVRGRKREWHGADTQKAIMTLSVALVGDMEQAQAPKQGANQSGTETTYKANEQNQRRADNASTKDELASFMQLMLHPTVTYGHEDKEAGARKKARGEDFTD